jgi:hypothetical protein
MITIFMLFPKITGIRKKMRSSKNLVDYMVTSITVMAVTIKDKGHEIL